MLVPQSQAMGSNRIKAYKYVFKARNLKLFLGSIFTVVQAKN